jgi:hypothetical protein
MSQIAMSADPRATHGGQFRREHPAPPEAALEWSFHPWRERPLRSAAALAAGLGLCLLVASLGEGTVLTLALCGAVIAAVSPLLAPVGCRVDGDGVSRRGPFGSARRRWDELRRGASCVGGLLVSPYRDPHWLDPWRGLLLPLPRSRRAELLAELRRRMEPHGL